MREASRPHRSHDPLAPFVSLFTCCTCSSCLPARAFTQNTENYFNVRLARACCRRVLERNGIISPNSGEHHINSAGSVSNHKHKTNLNLLNSSLRTNAFHRYRAPRTSNYIIPSKDSGIFSPLAASESWPSVGCIEPLHSTR